MLGIDKLKVAALVPVLMRAEQMLAEAQFLDDDGRPFLSELEREAAVIAPFARPGVITDRAQIERQIVADDQHRHCQGRVAFPPAFVIIKPIKDRIEEFFQREKSKPMFLGMGAHRFDFSFRACRRIIENSLRPLFVHVLPRDPAIQSFALNKVAIIEAAFLKHAKSEFLANIRCRLAIEN